MEVLNVKQSIMHNELGNFYVFTGVESQVQRVYIQKIGEVSKKPVKYIDKVLDIYGRKSGLFVSQSFTYVCIEDRDFISNEHAWETIDNAIGNSTLILWYTSIDKRSKFYKQFSTSICDFEHMKPEIIRKHIKENIDLSDTNCDTLMQYCENDYSRCLLEIDKIKHFRNGYGQDKEMLMPYDGAFLHLVNDGVIYKPLKDVIFEFADAVIDRKYRLSMKLLHQYELSEESTLKALTVLYNTFKRVLQVQSCKSDNIQSSTGLNDWEVRYGINHKGQYSIGELIRALRIIRDTEVKYKQGLIDDDIMLPYVLVNVL